MAVEILGPTAAQECVQAGSAVGVIPYSSYKRDGTNVVPSTYTAMAAEAAALLYEHAGPETNFIVPGERPYRNDPSTTDVVMQHLRDAGYHIPADSLPEIQPRKANGTPQQISWLDKQFGDDWRRPEAQPPVLVGHRQHLPRVALLCELFSLPAWLTDASEVLESAGKLTEEHRNARDLHALNEPYEQRAMRMTRLLAPLGAAATALAFRAFVALRSPTVIDVAGSELYATTRRRHHRELRRAAEQAEAQINVE